jgi:hypothetical protein
LIQENDMPRGIPNKKKEEVKEEKPFLHSGKPEGEKVKESHDDFTARVRDANAKREADIKTEKVAVKQELAPLPAGLKYFESPEGFTRVGDADKKRLWIPEMNKGRGGWANSQR